jgi:hypothetical protein
MYMAQHPTLALLSNPATGLANRVKQFGARPIPGGDPSSGAYKLGYYGPDIASLALGGIGMIGKLRELLAAEDGLATESNVATVTQHLDNIGALDHPPNAAMLSRIQGAIGSGWDLTPGETNFMTHELSEANLMKQRGGPGSGSRTGWTNAPYLREL